MADKKKNDWGIIEWGLFASLIFSFFFVVSFFPAMGAAAAKGAAVASTGTAAIGMGIGAHQAGNALGGGKG
ncbi:MAG: hypothetical protein FWD15_03605 [Alphaproteobacteria bacterium]|nr:hypothetical protein [Alphaproteobacteria bacterium]